MKLETKNLLTPNEVTFLLIGIMMDVSVTQLPSLAIIHARQDGWISVIIGAVYPLYVALLAIYVSNKYPKDNILALTKKLFGKPLGTFLNILFMISFFSYIPPLISLMGSIVRVDILQSISKLQFSTIFLLVSVYAASKGIKVLGRISTICFIMVIAIILPTLLIIKEGSILNIQPVFQASLLNILKGSESTIYDYSLMEFVFLIYPFINDSKKIKPAVLKSVVITCILYAWITFISIYYLGINIIPRTLYTFITVTEGVKLELLTNFRYIFVSFWIFIAAKSVSILSYIYMFILDDIRKVKNKNYVYLFISTILIIITLLFYKKYTDREIIIGYTSRISVFYNLFYITLVSIAIKIESRRKNERV